MSIRFYRPFLIVLQTLVGGVVVVIGLFAAASASATTYYWVGTSGGSFSTASNWSTTAGSACGQNPSGIGPLTTDEVVFTSNCTNNGSISSSFTIDGFEMQSGYSGTISTSGSPSITINGTSSSLGFTQAGGTFTSTDGTLSVGQKFNRTGGTFTHNSGTVELKPASAVTSVTYTTNNTTFYNLTMTKSAGASGVTMTLADSFSVANNLTITFTAASGTMIVQGSSGVNPTVTVTNDLTLGSFGGSSNTVGTSSASTNFSINLGDDYSMSDADVTMYAAITMNGSGTQTWTRTAGTWSADLTINKSAGAAELASALSTNVSNQDVTITEGTFDISGNNLTVNSSGSTLVVEDGGNLQLQGGETITANTNYPQLDSGSTVTYDGTSGPYTLKNYGYHHLTINGSSTTFNLPANLDANGTLTITAGTLDAVSGSNYSLNVAGDWSNSGTFTARSGTVTLDGTNQTLSGATTFYNLTKSVTTARTLTLPASTTQTITNTLTLNGASGALLSLRSSTSGTQARLDPQGTRTVSYLDVKDNNNINSTVISCTTGCTDSGNNTNWLFGSANAPTATTPTSITQATNGTGFVKFKTTVADPDNDETRLKVEYSRDGSIWKDLSLDSVTTSIETALLDNNATYQISSIDTDTSSVTVTIVWKSKQQLPDIYDDTVYLRVTPNDGTNDGAVAVSEAFAVDNATPTVRDFILDDRTATSLTLKWTPSSPADINFKEYLFCYSTTSSHARNCTASAKIWDKTKDSALVKQSTIRTTIPDLITNRTYYVLIKASDTYGNIYSTLGAFIPSDAPLAPILQLTSVKDVSIGVLWERVTNPKFIQGILCYGRNANRMTSSCQSNNDPNSSTGAGAITFTSLTPADATVSDLLTNTLYYLRFFATYSQYGTLRSNLVSARTCPPGQYRPTVTGACTAQPSPSASPSPSHFPSPSPSASPNPSGEPSASPAAPIASSAAEPSTFPQAEEGFFSGVVETIEKVITFLKELITSPRTAIPKLQKALKPIVDAPITKVINTVVTTTAAAAVVASASGLTGAPSMIAQLPHALARLWQGLLGLLGFKPKKRPWGRVVDAKSGQAIAGAYVQVFDHQSHRLQSTVVTNHQGAFSSLIPPGTYEFRVIKPGWTLTPEAPLLRLVSGEHIYDGRPITITTEKLIPLVLALRMTEAVSLTKHVVLRSVIQWIELFLVRLSWPLLIFGSGLNSLSVFASPNWITGGIEIFYVVLIAWKLRLHFKHFPALGVVRDAKTNRPLDLAIVRLYDAITGNLLETRTTSAEGKFVLLPPPGVYTISVTREGYEAYREAHVVVDKRREALALAFNLTPLPTQQLGVSVAPA